METIKMVKQKPISRIIGVNIVNSGNLKSDSAEDRFQFMQLIKISFMIDFNAARKIINDMFTKKFKEPYPIKGFTFDSNIFSNTADKYGIEYGYIHAEVTEVTLDKDNKLQDCRGLSKFNINQLSEYITGLENQNYSLQAVLRERNLEIAMMQQSILNIHRSIKQVLPGLSASKVTFDALVKEFNTQDE